MDKDRQFLLEFLAGQHGDICCVRRKVEGENPEDNHGFLCRGSWWVNLGWAFSGGTGDAVVYTHVDDLLEHWYVD